MKKLISRFRRWRQERRTRNFVLATLTGEVSPNADLIRLVRWLWQLRITVVAEYGNPGDSRTTLLHNRWYIKGECVEHIILCDAATAFWRIAESSALHGFWVRATTRQGPPDDVGIVAENLQAEELASIESMKLIVRSVESVAWSMHRMYKMDSAYLTPQTRSRSPSPGVA